MKVMLNVLLSLFLCLPVTARDETLISGEIESGWYGGPVFIVGSVHDNTGFLIGGQGGWIINHRLVLGGKGYILANPFEIENLHNVAVGFGCGGAYIEYILASDKLVHFSVECMIGGGGVYNDVKDFSEYDEPIEYTGDGCFVIEPGVNVMLNIMHNFRVGLGVNYRLVYGADYDAGAPYRSWSDDGYEKISGPDLSGLAVRAILKFGVF
ncbi:hypothetical protein JW948_11165 [bacterium]|nr:hypothetical protein [bacterium]